MNRDDEIHPQRCGRFPNVYGLFQRIEEKEGLTPAERVLAYQDVTRALWAEAAREMGKH